MQNVDRPAHVQALPQPARAGRACVQGQALRDVLRAKDMHWIGGHGGLRWNLWHGPAIRSPKLERAVGLSIDVITLLVDRAVVPATEHREVRERRRSALRPVADVMPLAERKAASREAAAPVPMVERSS